MLSRAVCFDQQNHAPALKGTDATHARIRILDRTIVTAFEPLPAECSQFADPGERQQQRGPIQSASESTESHVRQPNDSHINGSQLGNADPDACASPSRASSRLRHTWQQPVFAFRHAVGDVESVGNPGTINIARINDD